MYEDDDEKDQTKAASSTRGTEPTDRSVQTLSATAAPAATQPQAQRFQMPWARAQQAGGMPWGQPPAAPNGNTGVVGPGQGQPVQGGQPGFGFGMHGQGGMPNWQALAQQFQQRFAQHHPFLQRLGMGGQGMPPGAPQGQPGGTPPIWAGPQAAQGQPQPGAAPQGQAGPLQGRLAQLAQLFGRQQPGGIVGPGQGPQGGSY